MPGADAAVRIARVLGVSVEYLVTGIETINNKKPIHFPPEIRHIINITEKLKPEYQKIALSLIETLKKHEELQSKVE